MLNTANLEKFTKQAQTSPENVVREYCEHVFLSFLYKQPGSNRLLFKGGTALRIVFHSPRFSEDLDFSGVTIRQSEVEDIFTNTLANLETIGMKVDLREGKPTTGGYLGMAMFTAYGIHIPIQIEVSLRERKDRGSVRALIENDYIPAYSLVHESTEGIASGKMQALINRHKPRDFYDYFFLLSGNYPIVKEKDNLGQVLALLKKSKINFCGELKKFLPASHAMHLRDFPDVLEQKIKSYL